MRTKASTSVSTGVLALLSILAATRVAAEDGYALWLRYPPLDAAAQRALSERAGGIVVPAERSAATQAAVDELARGLGGMLGRAVPLLASIADVPNGGGAVVIGTPRSQPLIAKLDLPLGALGGEGYALDSARIDGKRATVVAANTDVGALYGAFALLEHLQATASLDDLHVRSAPKIKLRLLNHWDNPDRSVERGYAGRSLWDWTTLPEYRDPRYTDYARANASIGINGTVINNVNAKAESLSPEYIAKSAVLADIFRPYGIRVYFAARFSAPIELGGLPTADPLDPAVRAWWRAKADEIYAAIPNFGGFLVKADSEGQPGPQAYGRTHADGANMLAAAVAPHGGVVLWRAFVYATANPEDRAKQAYEEFVPLDGKFAANVIVQVKNGPIDFQPREPFHPLFGAMPKTALAPELQITKEYLGFASHLVYLGPLFEELLSADTYAQGKGSTVAKVVDGALYGRALTAIAGVANTGTDRDWTGSSFNQANWYAYGRLAWDPERSSEAIAREWLAMTFSREPKFVDAAARMMMLSREAPVDYMTPLGLAHLMATGHHYGPGPWVSNLDRPEWNPVYYHRADATGIGFDRTATGSNAVAQYAKPVAQQFAHLDSVPERYLLWFHHVPWDYAMPSGRTLWDELVLHYDSGVAEVEQLQTLWAGLEPYVDAQRFDKTTALLAVQQREAQWWRDACIAYFQSISKRPLPNGVRPPEHALAYYEAIDRPYSPR